MNGSTDCTSTYLERHEFVELVESLPTILRALLGDVIVTCQYGALSKLHPNLWYVPMDVGMQWLDRFFRESIEQQIFKPGGTDLHVSTRDGALDVRLCHEGDIHVTGSNPELVLQFVSYPAVARHFRHMRGA